jgi:hypothetical protein
MLLSDDFSSRYIAGAKPYASGASYLQNLKTFLALTDELCCLGFIYPTLELTQVSGDRD